MQNFKQLVHSEFLTRMTSYTVYETMKHSIVLIVNRTYSLLSFNAAHDTRPDWTEKAPLRHIMLNSWYKLAWRKTMKYYE